MSAGWQFRRPDLLESMKQQLQDFYPTLHFAEREGKVFIKGGFPVGDGTENLDWYQLEIEFKEDYPESLPVVREIARRIPKLADRHVNPSDGSLCLGVPDSFYMDGTAKAPFTTFLEGPVRTFLLGNSMVEQGLGWPFGEWGHGAKGILEYYSQLFSLSDLGVIAHLVFCALEPCIKGHVACPCKSGKNFRRCHSEMVRKVESRVPISVLRNACIAILSETHNSGVLMSLELREAIKKSQFLSQLSSVALSPK
jgi:hypothetical protein